MILFQHRCIDLLINLPEYIIGTSENFEHNNFRQNGISELAKLTKKSLHLFLTPKFNFKHVVVLNVQETSSL